MREVLSERSPCLIDLTESQALLWVFQGWIGKEKITVWSTYTLLSGTDHMN